MFDYDPNFVAPVSFGPCILFNVIRSNSTRLLVLKLANFHGLREHTGLHLNRSQSGEMDGPRRARDRRVKTTSQRRPARRRAEKPKEWNQKLQWKPAFSTSW